MSDLPLTDPDAQPAPYGTGPAKTMPGGGRSPGPKRIRVPQLQAMKQRGERFAMLTAYDQYAAEIFDEAGIPVLLVGDSAGNNVFGYETTIPVTVDQMIMLTAAVVRSVRRALVVGDMPFGSYQGGPDQALANATRFMKEAGAHAVKMEGGDVGPQVALLTAAGIPVMCHIGFTPQSEHLIGGYRIQGRGAAADRLVAQAQALEEAGAFALVMEMVPTDVAERVTKSLRIPTIGIGAGPHCDGQVLVWQDMAGLRGGKMATFVKQYADLRGTLLEAARTYATEVLDGTFPSAEQSFD